jgi:hypothetical protein
MRGDSCPGTRPWASYARRRPRAEAVTALQPLQCSACGPSCLFAFLGDLEMLPVDCWCCWGASTGSASLACPTALLYCNPFVFWRCLRCPRSLLALTMTGMLGRPPAPARTRLANLYHGIPFRLVSLSLFLLQSYFLCLNRTVQPPPW